MDPFTRNAAIGALSLFAVAVIVIKSRPGKDVQGPSPIKEVSSIEQSQIQENLPSAKPNPQFSTSRPPAPEAESIEIKKPVPTAFKYKDTSRPPKKEKRTSKKIKRHEFHKFAIETRRKRISEFSEEVGKPGFTDFYNENFEIKNDGMARALQDAFNNSSTSVPGEGLRVNSEEILSEIESEFNLALEEYLGSEDYKKYLIVEEKIALELERKAKEVFPMPASEK